jgi:hypothetical protein
MIYPSILNLTILQDSTFEQDLIVAESSRPVSINDATNVFTSQCHGFVVGTRVAFASSDGTELPCGLTGGVAYFVLADGLTGSTFKVSATSGGTEVDVSTSGSGGGYTVGKVLDLTPYTFDADIRQAPGGADIASFTCTVLDAASGTLRLSMVPATTLALAVGQYFWDLKLKTAQKSFFYAKGQVSVESTISRDP